MMKTLALTLVVVTALALAGCSKSADAATMDRSPDAGKVAMATAPSTKMTAGGIPKPTATGLDPTK